MENLPGFSWPTNIAQGAAVKQNTNGEVEERNYADGKLNGKATVIYPDSSKEMRTYKVRKWFYGPGRKETSQTKSWKWFLVAEFFLTY